MTKANENKQEQQVEVKEVTIKVGHIGSGKKFILSFYDKKGGKQIQVAPFIQKDKSRVKGVADGYYKYSHHFDMREGQDVEKLAKRFTSIKPITKLSESAKKYERISESSYTEWCAYQFYKLIQAGKMNLEGTNKKGEQVKVTVEWSGEPMEEPQIVQVKEPSKKQKVNKAEETAGLEF